MLAMLSLAFTVIRKSSKPYARLAIGLRLRSFSFMLNFQGRCLICSCFEDIYKFGLPDDGDSLELPNPNSFPILPDL